MNLSSVEAELKAGLAKIGSLIFTPRTKHPVLDELRELIVQEVQAHLGIVTSGAVALGNTILQRVEQALGPAAPPAPTAPATPANTPQAKEQS